MNKNGFISTMTVKYVYLYLEHLASKTMIDSWSDILDIFGVQSA